jgi:hypothetical protein
MKKYNFRVEFQFYESVDSSEVNGGLGPSDGFGPRLEAFQEGGWEFVCVLNHGETYFTFLLRREK